MDSVRDTRFLFAQSLQSCKAIAYLLAASALPLLAGCASESRGPSSVGNDPCPAVGNLQPTATSNLFGAVTCRLSGTLTTDGTLRAEPNPTWELTDDLNIGDAATAPTLTIEPGVTLRVAEPNTRIYVAIDATLLAVAAADERIWIRTSPNSPAETAGGWGGLIIEDNQGSAASRLNHVLIDGGGRTVTLGNESYSAGLTLVGEHSNTRVTNVQVLNSAGDGIALRSDGGNLATNTARLENILITNASRHGVVSDDFAGLLKHLLLIHQDASALSGIRIGGDNADPVLINATLIGNDPASGTAGGDAVGFVFENNASRARIANSLSAGFESGCYTVTSGADLSNFAVAATGLTTERFVDGLHCIDTVSGGDNPVGSGLPASLQVADVAPTNVGLNYYGDLTSEVFYGQSVAGSASTFSPSWYFVKVTVLGTDALNDSSQIRRYNNGAQPTNQADLGFPASPLGSDFDLSVVGAISSDEDTRFDLWAEVAGLERRP